MLRSRALRFFGKYGYGLYVFHVPLIPVVALVGLTPLNLVAWIGSGLGGALVYITAMMAISTVAALISWHAWEKQFLKFKPVVVKSRVQLPERIASVAVEAG